MEAAFAVIENMFSLDSIRDFEEQTKTITVGDETFKIRQLDGIDLLRLGDKKTTEEKFMHVVSVGVLDGKTDKQIGEKYAYKFCRSKFGLLVDLFNAILAFSNALEKEIDDAVEEEKKNFDVAADSNCTAADIANDTGSIPEPSI